MMIPNIFNKKPLAKFILYLEMDLSLNTGYSINERESVISLLKQYSNRVIVVAPHPEHPEIFYDKRILYVHNHARHHPAHYPLFLLSSWRMIRKLLSTGAFAAVICRLGPMPLLPLLLEWHGVPVILKTMAGHSYFERRDRQWQFKLLSLFSKSIYSKALHNSIGGDTMSPVYIKWFKDCFGLPPAKVHLIPNGVNTWAFKPDTDANSKYEKKFNLKLFKFIVGYVGALDSIRYLENVIDSIKSLAHIEGLGLVLVGDGPLRASLKAKVKLLGLAEKVVFTGSLPYSAIPSIINSFDVGLDTTCVSISIKKKTLFASYSQKIPQYLACGVPVVAWDTKDTHFLQKYDIGRLARLGDSKSLAAAILYFATKQINDLNNYAKKARSYALENLSSTILTQARFQMWLELTQRNK